MPHALQGIWGPLVGGWAVVQPAFRVAPAPLVLGNDDGCAARYALTEYLDAGNCSLGTTGLGSITGAVTPFIATRSDGTTVAWGGDLSVEANTANYCTSTPNSTGFAATIRATGSATLGSSSLTLGASFVPDGPALFFHGPAQQQVPFGNGTLCVAGGLVRILSVIVASGGQVEVGVDLPCVGITTPGPRSFRCYFRDTAAGGAGFDSSDALEITFVL